MFIIVDPKERRYGGAEVSEIVNTNDISSVFPLEDGGCFIRFRSTGGLEINNDIVVLANVVSAVSIREVEKRLAEVDKIELERKNQMDMDDRIRENLAKEGELAHKKLDKEG